jgi:hypothetical protein
VAPAQQPRVAPVQQTHVAPVPQQHAAPVSHPAAPVKKVCPAGHPNC